MYGTAAYSYTENKQEINPYILMGAVTMGATLIMGAAIAMGISSNNQLNKNESNMIINTSNYPTPSPVKSESSNNDTSAASNYLLNIAIPQQIYRTMIEP